MKVCRCIVLLFLVLLTALLSGSCANKPLDRDKHGDTRVQQLENAMAYLDVCSAEQAIDLWVRGLKERSAAMQYAVMDSKLKERYASVLKKNAPDWVTGVSSPWVSDYSIFDISETAQGLKLYSLNVTTETSAGPAQTYLAVLVLDHDGSFWHITALSLDEELRIYTGGLID